MDNQIQTHNQGELITGVPDHLRESLPKDVVAHDSGHTAIGGAGGELASTTEGGRSGQGVISIPEAEFNGDPSRTLGHPSNPNTVVTNNP